MKERITVSVEPEILEDVRAEVAAGNAPNVSAAVEEALRMKSRRRALQESLDMLEAEYGPIGKEAEDWARKELERVSRERSSSTPEP